jgi:hypothetical protein
MITDLICDFEFKLLQEAPGLPAQFPLRAPQRRRG